MLFLHGERLAPGNIIWEIHHLQNIEYMSLILYCHLKYHWSACVSLFAFAWMCYSVYNKKSDVRMRLIHPSRHPRSFPSSDYKHLLTLFYLIYCNTSESFHCIQLYIKIIISHDSRRRYNIKFSFSWYTIISYFHDIIL